MFTFSKHSSFKEENYIYVELEVVEIPYNAILE